MFSDAKIMHRTIIAIGCCDLACQPMGSRRPCEIFNDIIGLLLFIDSLFKLKCLELIVGNILLFIICLYMIYEFYSQEAEHTRIILQWA